jgi:hypothetical protein
LVRDGAGTAVGHTSLKLAAKASLDSEYGRLARVLTTAAIVGAGETAIADFTGRLGPLDGGTTANRLAREELADTCATWIVARAIGSAVAALRVVRA